jgi:hypothetical protein
MYSAIMSRVVAAFAGIRRNHGHLSANQTGRQGWQSVKFNLGDVVCEAGGLLKHACWLMSQKACRHA